MLEFYPWKITTLALLLAILTACSGAAGETSATLTVQAERSHALATQMALGMQATWEAQAAEATATAQAIQLALENAKSWPLEIGDDFEQDQGIWTTGESTDELGSSRWSIANGVYRWEATANQSMVWWSTPDMSDVADFYLAMDARLVEGPSDSQYGVVFRQMDKGMYYVFEINAAGQYAIYLYNDGKWEDTLPWSDTDLLLPDQSNRLAVVAQGSQLQFFINDQLISELSDAHPASGHVGLLIGLYNAGEKATWEFDNFELRKLPGAEETPTPNK